MESSSTRQTSVESRADSDRLGPDDHHPRNTRRIGCAVVLLGFVVILGLVLLGGMQSKNTFAEADRAAIARTEKLGIAASLPTYKAKYPSTERGRAGVKEAARIVSMLYYDYMAFEKTTSTVEVAPRSKFNVQWVLNNTRGGELSTSTLLAYHDANSTPMRDLLRIGDTCSFEELSWTYNSFDEPGIYLKPYLRMRETARVLLPTAIWLAMEDGDTTRAYTTLLNWMYIGQSLKVSCMSLIDGMVGVSLNGVEMVNIEELMRAAPPPSEAIAFRLYEQFSPENMRRDFLRSCEAEMIWMVQFMRFAAGTVEAPPKMFGAFKADFDKQFANEFADTCKQFADDLMNLRAPRTYPQIGYLMLRVPVMLRRKIAEAIFIMLEWQRKIQEIMTAPDVTTALAQIATAERWIEDAATRNPVTAISLPAFNRSGMNTRGRAAQAAVLRAAFMMRIAELRSDANTTMPRTIQELSERSGKPVPPDPLAAKAVDTIIYKPNPENGTYTITHSPSVKPYEGFPAYEFRGTWSPGK